MYIGKRTRLNLHPYPTCGAIMGTRSVFPCPFSTGKKKLFLSSDRFLPLDFENFTLLINTSKDNLVPMAFPSIKETTITSRPFPLTSSSARELEADEHCKVVRKLLFSRFLAPIFLRALSVSVRALPTVRNWGCWAFFEDCLFDVI